jgi:hypothetical protein
MQQPQLADFNAIMARLNSTQFIDFEPINEVFENTLHPNPLDLYDALADAGIEPHGAHLTAEQLERFADFAITVDHYGQEWSMAEALEFARAPDTWRGSPVTQ